MKIATWNINSVRLRLPLVEKYLREAAPDFLLLQEIKCQDPDFPAAAFKSLGFDSFVFGQKSYHGVAILARESLDSRLSHRGLPGFPTDPDNDPQARYIELEVAPADQQPFRLGCLYAPNGNPVENSAKYANKILFMERLQNLAAEYLAAEIPFVLAGDFNICPTANDLFDPQGWIDDSLFRLESRQTWFRLINLGLVDAVRALHPTERLYSFWDYQAGRWPRGEGLRIDHFLLSPTLADRLKSAEIDREPRGWEQTSDHTVVTVEV
ncbi:MAG: exodeoxyribonuclease III [Candidatus Pacebacteria bacterium]|nr:exodeoxyribonuclease III [Candidatus Paceibacterota bacterium]